MRLFFASALFLVAACSSEHRDEQRRPLDALHQDTRCKEAASFDKREPHHRVLSHAGLISSESIAKDVAYSYLKAVYPDDRYLRPMTATLSNGVWTVNGTLPKAMLGGVAGIALCQSNGRVLEIAHGR
jgi:hypothetical protein